MSKVAAFIERIKRLKGPIVAIAGVGAVLSGLVGYYTTYRTVASTAAPGISTAAVVEAINPMSVVVLPFANQTGEAGKAYIADALTTSITADLSRIREALIIGTATAFTYKDKPVALSQIGRELGVRFVLQGSVQSSGQQVRIQAQLSDTSNNGQVWSESFDGDSTQLFVLQDQVTTRIASSIGREIAVIAGREGEQRASSPKVADLMFRAIALENLPRTLENTQKREDFYRQILRLDPTNANAMARLGRVLWFEGAVFASRLPQGVAQSKKAEGYALAFKARDLDPNNVIAYHNISRFYGDKGDLQGRKNALETALALDPKSATTLMNMANVLNDLDEPEKAIESAKKALQLDPRIPTRYVASQAIASSHLRLGNLDAAVEWFNKAIAENSPEPLQAGLAIAYALKGDNATAKSTVAELFRLFPKFDFNEEYSRDVSAPASLKQHFEKVILPAARKIELVR